MADRKGWSTLAAGSALLAGAIGGILWERQRVATRPEAPALVAAQSATATPTRVAAAPAGPAAEATAMSPEEILAEARRRLDAGREITRQRAYMRDRMLYRAIRRAEDRVAAEAAGALPAARATIRRRAWKVAWAKILADHDVPENYAVAIYEKGRDAGWDTDETPAPPVTDAGTP
jgi:hypothetical protein